MTLQTTGLCGIRFREHCRKFEARKTINKQTYTKTFKTLDEAVAWRKQQEDSKKSECHLSCGQLFYPWIEFLENSETYSKRTPFKYRKGIKRYYQKYFGDKKLKDIDDKLLMNFVILLSETFKLDSKTVKDHISALSSFFEYCCLRYHISINPAKSNHFRQMMSRYFKTTKKKFSRILEKSRTPEEVQKVLKAAFEEGYEFGVATTFIFVTGVRLGEIAALMWTDLIKDDSGFYYCLINKNLNPIDKTLSKQAKSGSDGYVPVPPSLAKHLEALKTQRLEDSNFIFPMVHRNQDGFSRRLGKLSESIDVRRTTTHPLRHSCISYLGTHGVNMQIVQKAARHSKISMTEAYFNASYLNLDKVSAAMENFLVNSSHTSCPN